MRPRRSQQHVLQWNLRIRSVHLSTHHLPQEEPGAPLLRYGDIDLVIRSEQYSATASAISAAIAANEIDIAYYIDLHRGFEDLDDHSFDDLYSHSSILKLDDVDVRVLSPEDHLRILCV